jgi:hypothetical protein
MAVGQSRPLSLKVEHRLQHGPFRRVDRWGHCNGPMQREGLHPYGVIPSAYRYLRRLHIECVPPNGEPAPGSLPTVRPAR